jgi:hypothetical protein
MNTIIEKTRCTYCGDKLDEEEIETPSKDGAGDPMCDECWHDHYEFTCYLVVKCLAPGDYEDVIPGIYYIKSGPYHGGSLLGGGLFNRKLLRLRDLPNDSMLDRDYYPTGHLCRTCVDMLNLAKHTEYVKACKELRW